MRRCSQFVVWLTLAVLIFTFPAGASIRKLSPLLQKLVKVKQGQVKPTALSRDSVEVLIRGNISRAAIENLGGTVRSVLGNIATAKLPVNKLLQIAELPEIQYIEPSVRCRPLLDISTSNATVDSNYLGINADTAQLTYDGTDVIIGIVDTGIDWSHGDFIDDNDSTSRILYIWDQTLTPQAGESSPSGYNYGVEYTKSQIDDEIDGSPANFVREEDTDGHGTHVAGIAAGDGSDTDGDEPAGKYKGVAPDADLIVVKTDFYTSRIIDAVNYMISKADSLGKPIVINLSLGSHDGPHDGTSNFETALSNACGTSKMIVISAGNEKGDHIHAEASYSSPSVTTSFYVSSGVTDVGIDLWHDGGDGYTCTVQDPNGNSVSVAHGQSGTDLAIGSSTISIWNATSSPSNGDKEIVIEITDPSTGEWDIILSNRDPSNGNGEFDMWIYEPSEGEVYFTSNVSEDELVGEPGNAQNCLTVASYNTKKEWVSDDGNTYYYSATLADISSFSSVGPTRDGRLKPEIAAPGKIIGSSLSSDASIDQSYVLKDGRHCIMQGTSMSAPHVAGAVALIYDKYPSASVSQVRSWILNTARGDSYASGLPNNTWGYGKLDVVDMLDATLPVTLSSIQAIFDGDKVILNWRTETEVENTGFNVYRSDEEEGKYQRIGWVGSEGSSTMPNDYLFTDESVEEGKTYFYYVESVEISGERIRSEVIQVRTKPYVVPRETVLLQCYPNPFNPETWIPFVLAKDSTVTIHIYNLMGGLVRELNLGRLRAGYYVSKERAAYWDGRNELGERVASGVYIYRMIADDRSFIKRMVILK